MQRSGSQVGLFVSISDTHRKPALLDVNLLGYEFRMALSSAVQRAVNRIPASAWSDVCEEFTVTAKAASASISD